MLVGKECRGLCHSYYPHAERFINLSYTRISLDGEIERYKKCMECQITINMLSNDDVSCKCCRNRFRYRARGYVRHL